MSAGWETGLVRYAKKDGEEGGIIPCVANAILILTNAPQWRGVLAYDEFVGDITAAKAPPFRADLASKVVSVDWSDADMVRTAAWLQRSKWGLNLSTSKVAEAVRVVAHQKIVHPVRDWLNSLAWDGKARLDTWLIRLAGAADNEYVRAVSSKFLIAAVARVMRPGAKSDCMLILEGAQGVGKSTLLHDLASEPWFLETNIEIGTKDSYQALRKKWIIELGELDSLGRSEVSRTKQFLSQRIDSYRPSYGRASVDFPRQCVFAGTVNPDGGGYLKDNTGGRRFWPVEVKQANLKGLNRERSQLWAEATARYAKGEEWFLRNDVVAAVAAEEVEQRYMPHPWEERLMEWLLGLSPLFTSEGVTANEALEAIGIPMAQRHPGNSRQVATCLERCGWAPGGRKRIGGVAVRPYLPRDPVKFGTEQALFQAEQKRLAQAAADAKKKRADPDDPDDLPTFTKPFLSLMEKSASKK